MSTFLRDDGTFALVPGGGGSTLDIVNVMDFGAVGDNTADDTAAIQAAIDYAITNNRQVVFLPAGQYKTTSSLFMDPPPPNNGLRVGYPPANPNPAGFQFSFGLVGEAGLPNEEGDGTALRPTFNDGVALYVGPGQGMRVANLTIRGPANAYRGALNPNGVGVGLTGTGGGSSRTTIENVGVTNFYAGFKTAANGNGTLGDSNTFIKCYTNNVYYGFYIAGTQNYINSFYDCNPNGSSVGLFNGFGNGCRVFGGNWSNNASLANTFTISATSPVTATASGNNFDFNFTTTVAGNDGFIGNVYNSYAIKTARFGIIPLLLTAFNSGTGVASFTCYQPWSFHICPRQDAVANADLSAEIQAATTLYAADRVTTFWGNGIQVHGVHIENAYSPMTLLHTGEGFGSQNNVILDAIQFNYNPSLADLKSSADPSANIAKWYIQQSWGFIILDSTTGQVTIQNSQLGQGQSTEPLLIDVFSHTQRLVFRENNKVGPINMRAIYNGGFTSHDGSLSQPALGGNLEADTTPFVATGLFSNYGGPNWFWGGAIGQHPMIGWRPTPWSRPNIDPSHIAALMSLPAITFDVAWHVDYPLMWGGQIYGTWAWQQAAGENYEVFSRHSFYTYGQDLTTTNVSGLSWSYKGQTTLVYANASALSILFPGLGVKLFDGSSDILYIVTGIYPALGYFTVARGDNADGGVLSGNKTTIFTGFTIKQEPFALTVVSGPKTPVTKTADFTVKAIENSIIVNKGSTCIVTLPSASLYVGRSITIKTIQAFTVVSASANVIPLAGGAATTAILAATAGKWAELTANGTNWEIVQSN